MVMFGDFAKGAQATTNVFTFQVLELVAKESSENEELLIWFAMQHSVHSLFVFSVVLVLIETFYFLHNRMWMPLVQCPFNLRLLKSKHTFLITT